MAAVQEAMPTRAAKDRRKVFLPNSPQMKSKLRNKSMVTPMGSLSFIAKQVPRVFREQVDPNKAPEHIITEGTSGDRNHQRDPTLHLAYYLKAWEFSKIAMIPKCGRGYTQVESYRPESLLPIVSRMLNKLRLSQIASHLAENQVIHQHQIGFREKHGPTEPVFCIVSGIKSALEDRKITQ